MRRCAKKQQARSQPLGGQKLVLPRIHRWQGEQKKTMLRGEKRREEKREQRACRSEHQGTLWVITSKLASCEGDEAQGQPGI